MNNRDPPILFMSFRAGGNALGRGMKPVRIPFGCIVLYFTDLSNFSDFAYKFRGVPNLYYL